MGGGILREEVKCSDLESGDGCTSLQTDDESLSCTFYRVDFMTCELDSDLKIVIDKGLFFKRIHPRNTSYPKFCLVLTLLTSVGKQTSGQR